MSKESAGYLFARVDIDFDSYKQLKEEYEMTLLKVYDKRDRELYKQNEDWIRLSEKIMYNMEHRNELEAELRTLNEKK